MNLSSHKPTMLTLNALIFILAVVPSLRSTDPPLFHPDTGVTMLNKDSFKKTMEERTSLSLVAFVEPWDSSCDAMNTFAGVYIRMAGILGSSIPLYAVDCKENKQLCRTQKALKKATSESPILKAFPKNDKEAPEVYGSTDLSEYAILEWIMAKVPNHIVQLSSGVEYVRKWLRNTVAEDRAILFTESDEEDIPLYWKIIDIKYYGRLSLAVIRDHERNTRNRMKYPESKALIYIADDKNPKHILPKRDICVPKGSTYYAALTRGIQTFFAVKG